MAPFARTGAGERRAGSDARVVQARAEIVRQKGTVARHAGEPLTVRPAQHRPIEPRENAGERTGEIRHTVGDYRQLGIGKTRRIAVGVYHEAGALRFKASEHALQDSDSADRDSRLIAATHAAGETAC